MRERSRAPERAYSDDGAEVCARAAIVSLRSVGERRVRGVAWQPKILLVFGMVRRLPRDRPLP